MTLNKLQKQIAKLIEQGYGRCRVAVDKPSFRHNCESDGCVILPVAGIDAHWINDIDGDGGLATNKDGSERGRTTVILYGDSTRSTADQPTAAPCRRCGGTGKVESAQTGKLKPCICTADNGSQPEAALRHPVDIVKDLVGDALTPEAEAEWRAICDQPSGCCRSVPCKHPGIGPCDMPATRAADNSAAPASTSEGPA